MDEGLVDPFVKYRKCPESFVRNNTPEDPFMMTDLFN